MYLLPVPWLHPSCLLWRFVFEKDTMWTLDIDTHTHTNTHTHTVIWIYTFVVSVSESVTSSLIITVIIAAIFFCLFVCFSQSFHSFMTVGVFCSLSCLQEEVTGEKKKIKTVTTAAEARLLSLHFGTGSGGQGGSTTSWLCTFTFPVTDFWTPASVFTYSQLPPSAITRSKCPDCSPPPPPPPLLLFFIFFYTHHLPADYKLLLIAHRYCSVLFLFPFFSLCYAVEIIKKNISRSVRK